MHITFTWYFIVILAVSFWISVKYFRGSPQACILGFLGVACLLNYLISAFVAQF
jgi:hypothetical protein